VKKIDLVRGLSFMGRHKAAQEPTKGHKMSKKGNHKKMEGGEISMEKTQHFEIVWDTSNRFGLTADQMVELAKAWEAVKKEYKEILEVIAKHLEAIEVVKDDLAFGHSKVLPIILTEKHGSNKAKQLIEGYNKEDAEKLAYLQDVVLKPALAQKNAIKKKMATIQDQMGIQVRKVSA